MRRISLFHGVADDEAFIAAWKERRAAAGGTLLRSWSDRPEFPFAELAPGDTDAPDLPASVRSAVYEPHVDDLPDDVEPGCVWLNAYEVAPEDDERFVAAWTDIRETVRGLPGYQGSCLHRAVTPGATFRFFNVSPWATREEFTAAVATRAFADRAMVIFDQAHPALFDVVR